MFKYLTFMKQLSNFNFNFANFYGITFLKNIALNEIVHQANFFQ